MKNKTYWVIGSIASVGVLAWLILRNRSRNAIASAAANGAGIIPAKNTTTGNTDTQTSPTYQPIKADETYSMDTPAGKISTVPLYFTDPGVHTLYFAPQNLF